MISLLQPDSQPQRRVLRLLFHFTAGLVALGAGIVLYVMSHPATRRLLALKDQGGKGAAPLRTEEKEESCPLAYRGEGGLRRARPR
jgi:hypothetical protein